MIAWKIAAAFAVSFITWTSTHWYYKAEIESLQKEYAEKEAKIQKANEASLEKVIAEHNEKVAKINEEKESIRKSFTSLKSDNLRMHKLVAKLSTADSREQCLAERDRFAELAVEANGLLIEIDEALRINLTGK